MVAFEYRVVVPFTLDEFYRGFRYLCARQTQEVMVSSANGERMDRVEENKFSEVPDVVATHGRVPARFALCNNGNYIRNRLYLGARLPAWVRFAFPEAAMWIREEYWCAYPYMFCRYRSELWPNRLDFTIETLHLANDIGDTDNVFADMTEKERKSCELQVLDIAGEPANSTPGVYQGDPTSFKSAASGRGPLVGPGWWKCGSFIKAGKEGPHVAHSVDTAFEQAYPLMCIYKRAQCKLTNLPWTSSIEKVTLNSTVRDMAVLGLRNLFCWTDSWYNLSNADLVQFEKTVWPGTSA